MRGCSRRLLPVRSGHHQLRRGHSQSRRQAGSCNLLSKPPRNANLRTSLWKLDFHCQQPKQGVQSSQSRSGRPWCYQDSKGCLESRHLPPAFSSRLIRQSNRSDKQSARMPHLCNSTCLPTPPTHPLQQKASVTIAWIPTVPATWTVTAWQLHLPPGMTCHIMFVPCILQTAHSVQPSRHRSSNRAPWMCWQSRTNHRGRLFRRFRPKVCRCATAEAPE